jgi:uncharacterized membrane protein YkvA (DUF1232 family)
MSAPDVALIVGGAILSLYVLFVVALLLAGQREDARALAGFVPDCAVLFGRLLRDPCVSRGQRILLAGLVAYLALPIDLVPDFIPIAGQLDDAILAAFVLRHVLRSCEREIAAAWPGPQSSLALLLRLVGPR